MFTVTTLEHAPLEAVYIYFDTATYDEIERDEKVIFNSCQLMISLFEIVKRKVSECGIHGRQIEDSFSPETHPSLRENRNTHMS